MLKSGFFNSINGDRKYDATDFSSMFSGVINDGVFGSIGDAFAVNPNIGLTINVGTGRAWYNNTYLINDAVLPITLTTADVLLTRIDTIVIEVNLNDEVRENTIKVIKGTPSSEPVAPELVKENGVYQYPLANITIPALTTTLTVGNINSRIGSSDNPLVTGILETMTIDSIVAKWELEFQEWFTDVQSQLSEDVAGNLLYEIGLRLKISDKANNSETLAGTNNTKYITPYLNKVYADSIKPVSGYYSGTSSLTNSAGRSIQLGFSPSVVIVMDTSTHGAGSGAVGFAAKQSPFYNKAGASSRIALAVSSTGFTVYNTEVSSYQMYFDDLDNTYNYIAFR